MGTLAMHEKMDQPKVKQDLAKVEKIANFLDKQFRLPGGFHIGADGLIGLIPGVGDLFGAGISFWLIRIGRRHGLPKFDQFKMLCNIGIDMVLGSIPLLGDIFDFAWKSNVKNANIIIQYLQKECVPSRLNSDNNTDIN